MLPLASEIRGDAGIERFFFKDDVAFTNGKRARELDWMRLVQAAVVMRVGAIFRDKLHARVEA